MSDQFDKIIGFVRNQFDTREFIPLHVPRFVGNEKEYVLNTIESTFVSSVGEYVNQFEEEIADFAGTDYAVAAVNGTSALHMALLVSGVRENDLIITQPLTFVATCNAIRYLNADPLFIDISRDTLGIDPDKVESFLNAEATVNDRGECIHRDSGRKISACVPMHTFGHCVDMDRLQAVCDQYAIPVIEDAAEALGSRYQNQSAGAMGKVGVFSFNGNKIITCGGGGMIVTDDPDIAEHAKHLTTQAKKDHPWEYIHDEVGYNYRLPNLNAALGVAQMEVLDEYIRLKRLLAEKYEAFFEDLEIEFVSEPDGSTSNYWLNSILFKDREERDRFLEYSNENGVMTRPSWGLMPELEMFEDCISGDISVAIEIDNRLVNIPSSVIWDLH